MPQLFASVAVSALFALSALTGDGGAGPSHAPAIGVVEAWALLAAGGLALAWRGLGLRASA